MAYAFKSNHFVIYEWVERTAIKTKDGIFDPRKKCSKTTEKLAAIFQAEVLRKDFKALTIRRTYEYSVPMSRNSEIRN